MLITVGPAQRRRVHTDRSAAAEPKQRLADKICTGARLEAVRSLSLHTLLFGFFPEGLGSSGRKQCGGESWKYRSIILQASRFSLSSHELKILTQKHNLKFNTILLMRCRDQKSVLRGHLMALQSEKRMKAYSLDFNSVCASFAV